jgi:hypothetical protein
MENEGDREREVKSHQPKQDLTQFNIPYVVYACARIHSLFIECFEEAFLSSIEKKTPGRSSKMMIKV